MALTGYQYEVARAFVDGYRYGGWIDAGARVMEDLDSGKISSEQLVKVIGMMGYQPPPHPKRIQHLRQVFRFLRSKGMGPRDAEGINLNFLLGIARADNRQELPLEDIYVLIAYRRRFMFGDRRDGAKAFKLVTDADLTRILKEARESNLSLLLG